MYDVPVHQLKMFEGILTTGQCQGDSGGRFMHQSRGEERRYHLQHLCGLSNRVLNGDVLRLLESQDCKV
jgi:hypothetical protein